MSVTSHVTYLDIKITHFQGFETELIHEWRNALQEINLCEFRFRVKQVISGKKGGHLSRVAGHENWFIRPAPTSPT